MAALDQEAILEAIHHLPATEQLEIARRILAWTGSADSESLRYALRQLFEHNQWLSAPQHTPGPAHNKPSAANLRGIARMDNPPDDATVERWLDEHRAEKYGE